MIKATLPCYDEVPCICTNDLTYRLGASTNTSELHAHQKDGINYIVIEPLKEKALVRESRERSQKKYFIEGWGRIVEQQNECNRIIASLSKRTRMGYVLIDQDSGQNCWCSLSCNQGGLLINFTPQRKLSEMTRHFNIAPHRRANMLAFNEFIEIETCDIEVLEDNTTPLLEDRLEEENFYLSAKLTEKIIKNSADPLEDALTDEIREIVSIVYCQQFENYLANLALRFYKTEMKDMTISYNKQFISSIAYELTERLGLKQYSSDPILEEFHEELLTYLLSGPKKRQWGYLKTDGSEIQLKFIESEVENIIPPIH